MLWSQLWLEISSSRWWTPATHHPRVAVVGRWWTDAFIRPLKWSQFSLIDCLWFHKIVRSALCRRRELYSQWTVAISHILTASRSNCTLAFPIPVRILSIGVLNWALTEDLVDRRVVGVVLQQSSGNPSKLGDPLGESGLVEQVDQVGGFLR